MLPRRFLVLVLIFLGSLELTARDFSVPDLIRLGSVKVNESGHFQFELKNTSEENAEILEIKSSCICTSAELTGSPSLPVDEVRLVEGSARYGEVGDYKTNLTITVRLASGQLRAVVIPVTTRVVSPLLLDPPRVDFGAVSIQDSPTLTVNAKHGNAPQEWDSLQAKSDDERVTVATIRGAGGSIQLQIRFRPVGTPIGAFRSHIDIHLSQADLPLDDIFGLDIAAHVKGPLTSTPATIYCGNLSPGVPVDRTLTLTSSELDLRDLVVENQPADGSVEISEKNATVAKAKVQIVPSRAGVVQDTIVFFHPPSGLRLKLPVVGFTTQK